jgi:transcriptional regulator with XRE-family HTH domain
MQISPGELIRSTRKRHGLSQERLARRAGTKQSAISRFERDDHSPKVETLDLLMQAMGERLNLSGSRGTRDGDRVNDETNGERSPEDRLALTASWNLIGERLAAAGRLARAGV